MIRRRPLLAGNAIGLILPRVRKAQKIDVHYDSLIEDERCAALERLQPDIRQAGDGGIAAA
jgi:hypothetical protein